MRRFFYDVPHLLHVGNELVVTDGIFHHWCKVLRASVGEQAVFFDGQGGEYAVTLVEVSKKQAMVKVDEFCAVDRALPFEVQIGLVMSRGERMDYAIQKATELGVTAIHLLTSQHGEVRLKAEQIDKKLAHWQQVAVSACEQCGLNIVPQLHAPMDVSQWIDPENMTHLSDFIQLILAVPQDDGWIAKVNNENPVNPLSKTHRIILEQFKNSTRAKFLLLIGSEGGFSSQEVADAIQQGFTPWQIGERVLRTETAPVVALASLLAMFQTVGFL